MLIPKNKEKTISSESIDKENNCQVDTLICYDTLLLGAGWVRCFSCHRWGYHNFKPEKI